MFVFGNFTAALARVLDAALTLYTYIIIGRAVISWVSPDPYNPVVRFLYRATEPALYRIRRVLPDMGGIDLSPIVLLLAVYFVKDFLVRTLLALAYRF